MEANFKARYNDTLGDSFLRGFLTSILELGLVAGPFKFATPRFADQVDPSCTKQSFRRCDDRWTGFRQIFSEILDIRMVCRLYPRHVLAGSRWEKRGLHLGGAMDCGYGGWSSIDACSHGKPRRFCTLASPLTRFILPQYNGYAASNPAIGCMRANSILAESWLRLEFEALWLRCSNLPSPSVF